jgi:GxxExxY protein
MQLQEIAMDTAGNDNYKHSKITEIIIGAFYKVYNVLGYGFLEKVYENAMLIELQESDLKVESQKRINVLYKEYLVGTYCADLFVDDTVIIEIKAAESLREEHECQLINYLKATNVEVGLLLNFGKKPECRRKVFSKRYKKWNADDADL